MRVALTALLICATPLVAQVAYPPLDPGTFATKAEMTAAMPLPSTAAPPAETPGGALGSSMRYRRADDVQPRITRATTVTTAADGTFSGTWAMALSAAPTIIMTPINAGSQPIQCNLTSAPTTTTFAGKCWTAQTTLLNLSIITAGLTLAPATASSAGVSVQVIAIPPTQ